MPSEGAGCTPVSHDRATGIATSGARAAESRANGARAAASRANGSKSRGPKTAEGKARASMNALRHGLCAKKFLLLPDDSRAQFAALEAALLDDLAPQGALQTLLAHRLIAAAWRLQRADRLEFELFSAHDAIEVGPGRALVRDGRDARVFPTLLRYRGAAQAEFFRTLKALEAARRQAARDDDAGEAGTEAETKVGREGDVETRLGRKRAILSAPLAQKRASLSTNRDSFGSGATENEPERRPSGQESDTKATGNEPGGGAMRGLSDAPGGPTPREGRVGAGTGCEQLRPDPEKPNEPERPAIAAHGVLPWEKAARCRGPLFSPGENV
jgi:hypothetical protein